MVLWSDAGFLLASRSDLPRAPWSCYYHKHPAAVPARPGLVLHKELFNLKSTTGTECALLYPALTHLAELCFTQSVHNAVNIDKK